MSVTTGFQAIVEYNSGPPYNNWLRLGSEVTVKVPEVSVASVDATPLSSIAKVFIPGSVDYGTVTFGVYWTRDDYEIIHGLIREVLDWRITSPTEDSGEATIEFEGFITKIGNPEFKHDQANMVDVDVKISGAYTLGTAS